VTCVQSFEPTNKHKNERSSSRQSFSHSSSRQSFSCCSSRQSFSYYSSRQSFSHSSSRQSFSYAATKARKPFSWNGVLPKCGLIARKPFSWNGVLRGSGLVARKPVQKESMHQPSPILSLGSQRLRHKRNVHLQTHLLSVSVQLVTPPFYRLSEGTTTKQAARFLGWDGKLRSASCITLSPN
jgi:hypothetical protein